MNFATSQKVIEACCDRFSREDFVVIEYGPNLWLRFPPDRFLEAHQHLVGIRAVWLADARVWCVPVGHKEKVKEILLDISPPYQRIHYITIRDSLEKWWIPTKTGLLVALSVATLLWFLMME